MAFVVKDRVKETSTTTGTGTFTLAGAADGFQSFSVIGDGNSTFYTITDGTDWEVGVGTYTASGTTLSRDTILESSNSGSAVDWAAGDKDVFVTYPAEKAVYDGGPLGTPLSATLTNATGLPISTGVSGLAANVATFLATPSSNNLYNALTSKTGSTLGGVANAVFDYLPFINSPNLDKGTWTTGTLSFLPQFRGLVSSTAGTPGASFQPRVFNHVIGRYLSNLTTNFNIEICVSSPGFFPFTSYFSANGRTSVYQLVVQNGATAYYPLSVTLDQSLSPAPTVTTYWRGGAAPTSGTANGIDFYTFIIQMTASNVFSIFASVDSYA